jgi:hypothetical protein
MSITLTDGTVVIVEPFANDKLEDNLNPLGRLFYAASTMVCIPASLSLNGPALGAQAGEPRISEVVKAGGFKRFRRAAYSFARSKDLGFYYSFSDSSSYIIQKLTVL